MFKIEKITDAKGRVLIQDPPIAQFLFQGTIASWLWLGVRLYVGLAFITSGLGKFTGGKWLDGTGNSILPFWQNAVKIPDAPAKPLITFEWYRGFLQFMIDTNAAPWFSVRDRVRRDRGWTGSDRGCIRRSGGDGRPADEHGVHAGWHDQHQSGHGDTCRNADPGVEERWLHRPRLLPAADARHALEAIS